MAERGAIFAHPGVDEDPHGEGEGEEWDLEEGWEAVEDGDDGNPDAPGGDEGGKDDVAVVAGGEEAGEIGEGVAGVLPIVGPGDEGGGVERVEDELVDEDLGEDGGEGGIGAEPEGLLAVEEVDDEAGPGPVWDGEEEVGEIGACEAAFLEGEDAHELGDEGSGDDGGDGGVKVAVLGLEGGEAVEGLSGGRVLIVSDEEGEHDGLDDEGRDEISPGGAEAGGPGAFARGHEGGGLGEAELAVEGAVLDRFEDVVGAELVLSGEVGDGAGDLEDAIVGAGGEIELLHSLLEELGALGGDFAVLAHDFGAHIGVGAGAGEV